MFSILQDITILLIHITFDLYLLLILLRLLLQFLRADFHNPLCQLILKLTDPAVMPLRRIIPSIRAFDTATFTFAILVAAIKLMLLLMVTHGKLPPFYVLALWTFMGIVKQTINIFFYAIIIQALLSWIAPNRPNPLTHILFRLTSPVLGYARRLIPPVSGFDLSPLPVILVLLIFSRFIAPLTYG